ncbi:hypothetical protein BGW38_009919 [Lunasporangiospora selenospora]|uniref:Expansin-like EG45 domain-containing protein n=1 Tax=Lunasporangiospora selenospora TaxID=979761 RepID=A0A9P6G2V4_9FUNG|nr:hypothetical protein BGW38_009919 [Lunasporangiospora selenospora]
MSFTSMMIKSFQVATIVLALALMLAPSVEAAPTLQSASVGRKMSGKSTWYYGNDISVPACYGNIVHDYSIFVQDSWHIGAVHMDSYAGGQRSTCFQCAKVTHGQRSVIVRLIDHCPGCAPNHIDLTLGAFESLASRDTGVIDIQYEFVACPTGGSKWPSSPAPRS